MKNLLFICTILFISSGTIKSQFTWVHTNGPYGSVFSNILSNDQYAFVPAGDFLYRSPDGKNWEKLEHQVSYYASIWKDTLATLIDNPVSQQKELHISTDQGLHWTVHSVPPKVNEYQVGIAVCRSSVNILLIGKNIRYRSTDLGASWDTLAYPGQFSTQIMTLDSRIYLLRADGIKRSDEDGNNWSSVIAPPFSNYEQSFTMTATQDSILLFASDDHIWYTHDGGNTWANTTVYPHNSETQITTADQKVYVQTPYLLLRSGDFGITWDTLHEFSVSTVISAAALRDIYLFSTFEKGIFRWDEDVKSIVDSNTGLGVGQVNELALGQDRIWAACPNGVYAYDLRTHVWSDRMNIPIPDNEPAFVSANNDGWVVTSGQSGGFYFSEDNGQNWASITTNMFQLSGAGTGRVELLGNAMIALTNGLVMRSIDKGSNWDWVNVENIYTEIVHAHNKYYMASLDILYETADEGLTWIGHFLPFDIEGIGAYNDDLYLVSYENHTDELYTSPNVEDWYPGGKGYYSQLGYYAPYYYHNNFFRDDHHIYSFTGGDGSYVTLLPDLTTSILSLPQHGNDFVILDSVIYLGGQGMYVSQIEHPYINATQEADSAGPQIFSVDPNPVSDILHLTFNAEAKTNGIITVYSMDGIIQHTQKVSSSEKEISISVQDFPAAMYYIVFVGRDRVESHPCLKL